MTSLRSMKPITRPLLVTGILIYRALPSRIKHPCPREGATCSARSLTAARAGASLADLRTIVASCAPQLGKHDSFCEFPFQMLPMPKPSIAMSDGASPCGKPLW
jgi:hypothetical protein